MIDSQYFLHRNVHKRRCCNAWFDDVQHYRLFSYVWHVHGPGFHVEPSIRSQGLYFSRALCTTSNCTRHSLVAICFSYLCCTGYFHRWFSAGDSNLEPDRQGFGSSVGD